MQAAVGAKATVIHTGGIYLRSAVALNGKAANLVYHRRSAGLQEIRFSREGSADRQFGISLNDAAVRTARQDYRLLVVWGTLRPFTIICIKA